MIIRRHFSKYFDFLYIFLCLIGCLYQIYQVSSSYFMYSSVTMIRIEIPQKLESPGFTVCVHYMNLLDVSNITINGKSSKNIFDYEKILTVKEIFKRTPSAVHNVFQQCRYRIPGSFSTKYSYSDDCHNSFQMNKFFTQDFICYRMFSRELFAEEFDFVYLAYASNWNGMFFELELNKTTFAGLNWGKAIVHPMTQHPRQAIAFSPMFNRAFDSKGHPANGRFDLVYRYIDIENLPPPYETGCRDYSKSRLDGRGSSEKCFDECVFKRSTSILSRIPFTSIIKESNSNLTNLHHMLATDIDNRTTSTTLKKLMSNCRKTCSAVDCRSVIFMTQLTSHYANNDIIFRVDSPRDPVLIIKAVPKLVMAEYVIYLFSCIGTWLGVAVVSLNPMHLLNIAVKLFRKQQKMPQIVVNQPRTNITTFPIQVMTRVEM